MKMGTISLRYICGTAYFGDTVALAQVRLFLVTPQDVRLNISRIDHDVSHNLPRLWSVISVSPLTVITK